MGIGFAALVISKRPRFARFLTLTAFALLWSSATPFVANKLLHHLESFTEPRPLADEESAPVIVVLGGTVAIYTDTNFPAEEVGGSRIATAFRLYQLQKAARILVTSGIEYQRADGTVRTEADDMRELLLQLGVPDAAIVTEAKAQNTKENAAFSAKLLEEMDVREVLLVTSAYHLRRATGLFRAAGLSVHPVASGRLVRYQKTTIDDFVPTAHALSRTTSALKEILGDAFDAPLTSRRQ